jgi:hypothetical protein
MCFANLSVLQSPVASGSNAIPQVVITSRPKAKPLRQVVKAKAKAIVLSDESDGGECDELAVNRAEQARFEAKLKGIQAVLAGLKAREKELAK